MQEIFQFLVAVVTVAGGIFAWIINNGRKGAASKIQSILLKFVVEAEKLYGSQTGQVKKAHVIHEIVNSGFYQRLPFAVRVWLTEPMLTQMVDKFVQQSFNILKEENTAVKNFIETSSKKMNEISER